MAEDKGEMELILEDLKRETEEVMHELAEIEDLLVKMAEKIDFGKIDREELLSDIGEIRSRIGVIEHIDKKEYEEEESADNLMQKLKGMMSKCI